MTPMLAVKGTAADLTRPNTICDLKENGYRAIATRNGSDVRLTSREGTDLTGFAPYAAMALLLLPAERFILDCELVSFNDTGISDLSLLKQGELPRWLIAFDVLNVNGVDVCAQPLIRRKQLLKELAEDVTDLVGVTEWTQTQGHRLFTRYTEAGGEGVVCKRADSVYEGKRSKHWAKWKPHYAVQEAA